MKDPKDMLFGAKVVVKRVFRGREEPLVTQGAGQSNIINLEFGANFKQRDQLSEHEYF